MLTRITRTPGAALASIILEAERHGSTQARTLDALALATGSTARDLGAIVRGERFCKADDLDELAAVAMATKQSTGALCYGMTMRAGEAIEGEDDRPRYRFRMSTADVDRAHDIVDQSWKLADFNANPVALWAHRTDTPAVGVWRDVQVAEGGGLVGDIVPAPIESYPLSVTVAEQLRMGVLRTVSVGFLPGVAMHRSSFDPEDERHARRGVWFSSNALIECTLTPVPMNQAAVRIPAEAAEGDTAQRSAGVFDWLTTSTDTAPTRPALAWDWLTE